MIIKIPQDTKKFKQVGNSDILGNIWSSFNLDLTTNIGRIRVSPRGMIVSNDNDLGNLKTTVAFKFHSTSGSNQKIWAISGTKMFYNGGRPDQTYTQDANAGTPTVGVGSDMDLFNGNLVVVGTSEIRRWDGSAWTEIGADIGTSKTTACVYGQRFYYAKNDSAISSISTAWANANVSGSPNTEPYTLQLSDFGIGGSVANTITSIRASSNRIWIATVDASSQNYSAGRAGKVFEWDGVSTQANKVYYIDSIGALALIIKDDIPYVVDADGKLLKYNGTSFKEVARLPVPAGKFLRNPLNSGVDTFIHARGITIRDGRILMLINNEVDNSSATILENLPSGIWEYDEDIGLYHKHSVSMWQSGVTSTRTDFAQNRLAQVGALFNAKSTSNDSSLNSDLLIGASYLTDNSTTHYGIFLVDTNDTKSKIGYLVSPKIDSPSVLENWQKLYLTHKLLLSATDRICLKYRTSEIPAIEGAITWTSTTQFTTTLDLSSFAVGDEVEGIRGGGAGQIEHITAISLNAGTYTVTLANAVTGVPLGNSTARARFQKWLSLGEQTSQSIDFKEFPIMQQSSWIQIKMVMYFTGVDEVNYLQLVTEPHLPTV